MKLRFHGRWLWLGGAGIVVLIDQLSKSLIAQQIPEYATRALVPWLQPVLILTYVKNTGISFGMFPNLNTLFALLSACVVMGIIFFQRSLPRDAHRIYFSLGFVTGGALGNLIDRITRGFVVDFLDVNFWPFRDFAIFNLADSAILVGVALLLLDSFVVTRQEVQANG